MKQGLQKHPLIENIAKTVYHSNINKRQLINTMFYFKDRFAQEKKSCLKRHYCIITDTTPYMGTTSIWRIVAFKAIMALTNGYIPVIDMMNFKSDNTFGIYAKKNVNRWDLHYNQYYKDIDLLEIYDSNDAVFYTDNEIQTGCWFVWKCIDESARKEFHNIYKVIGPKEEVYRDALSHEFKRSTLGIMIRRSMEWGNKINHWLYTNLRGHHTRGHVDTYCDWIDKNLHKMGYDQFFLCTEDRETMEIMKNRYGSVCVHHDRPLMHMFEKGNPIPSDSELYWCEFGKDEDRTFRIEFDYLSETIKLSHCDALLQNALGQQNMAMIMREERIPLIRNNITLDMYERGVL